MKYAIDRIENNIATCQNLETNEMVEIDLNLLPKKVKDGTILIYEDEEYKLDLNEEELRRRQIQARFNRLRKKDV